MYKIYKQCLNINSAVSHHGVQSVGMAILQCDMHSVSQQQYIGLLLPWLGYRLQLTYKQVEAQKGKNNRAREKSGRIYIMPPHLRSGRTFKWKAVLERCIPPFMAISEVSLFVKYAAKTENCLYQHQGDVQRDVAWRTPTSVSVVKVANCAAA